VSSDNVEIVRRVMRQIAEEDLDAALQDVDPEAKLDWSNSEAPDRGVYHGHAGWRAWFDGRGEGLIALRFDMTEVIDAMPDTLVVVARLLGRGRASGVEVEAQGASVWTLREGTITGLTLYQTRGEALKAVGLDG
jgi:ketosteroid isomerase-like protein